MDIKGFEAIEATLEGHEIIPRPSGDIDLRFVSITTNSGQPAILLEKLGEAGLLYEVGAQKIDSDLPALEPYVATDQSITFIDRNTEEGTYDFSHLDDEERQAAEKIMEAQESSDILQSLNEIGVNQVKLSQFTGVSRPSIASYLNNGGKPNKRAILSIEGVKNAFINLVGQEGFSIEKTISILDKFYEIGSVESLRNPFRLNQEIRALIAYLDKQGIE